MLLDIVAEGIAWSILCSQLITANISNNYCAKITWKWKLASEIVTQNVKMYQKPRLASHRKRSLSRGPERASTSSHNPETCQTFHERITIYKRRRNFHISTNTFSRSPPTQFPNMLKPPKNNTRFPVRENKQT